MGVSSVPPAPVTDEEFVERVARLLYASGEHVGELAITAAREKWATDSVGPDFLRANGAEESSDVHAELAAEPETGDTQVAG